MLHVGSGCPDQVAHVSQYEPTEYGVLAEPLARGYSALGACGESSIVETLQSKRLPRYGHPQTMASLGVSASCD